MKNERQFKICMKSVIFPREATFCAYPHDDMCEIDVNRQTKQK